MGYHVLFWIQCLAATCVIANQMKFHYHVSEGKARFMQEIETDLEKDTVKYHTPAHNDVLESYQLQDFNKGLQVTCFPSMHECRLRDIDRDIHPSAGNVSESFLHSWNSGVNSIQGEHSIVVTERYYVEKEILSTAALGQELENFFNSFGFPLLQEAKLPANATLIPIIKSTVNGRKRREIINSFDCGSSQPVMKYGFTSGKHCHYMRICGSSITEIGRTSVVFKNCESEHITYPMAYQCLCCPPVPSVIDLSDTQRYQCAKMR